eukprot:6458321-Amphidinium_carterae.1
MQPAKDALYAYAWWFGLGTRGASFPKAKQALRAWRVQEPDASRDPASWEEVLAVSYHLYKQNTLEAAQAAAATLLAFDCYLRPTSCVTLTVPQVVVPRARGAANFFALILFPREQGQSSKTKTYDDTVQVGEPEYGRGWLRGVVRALVQQACQDRLFHTLSGAKWNALLRKSCASLGLRPLTAHYLRHGGPSHDCLVHRRDLHSVQQRVREFSALYTFNETRCHMQ